MNFIERVKLIFEVSLTGFQVVGKIALHFVRLQLRNKIMPLLLTFFFTDFVGLNRLKKQVNHLNPEYL